MTLLCPFLIFQLYNRTVSHFSFRIQHFVFWMGLAPSPQPCSFRSLAVVASDWLARPAINTSTANTSNSLLPRTTSTIQNTQTPSATVLQPPDIDPSSSTLDPVHWGSHIPSLTPQNLDLFVLARGPQLLGLSLEGPKFSYRETIPRHRDVDITIHSTHAHVS
jgi:hypothetical protein